MKTLFKIAALTVVMGLGANAMAAEETATAAFQWAGSIPPSNVNTDNVRIINTGTVDHDRGTLVFNEVDGEANTYKLVSSSELIFGVQKKTGAEWIKHNTYSYKLGQLQFSAGGGLVKSVSDAQNAAEFKILANDVELTKNTALNTTRNGDVHLSVAGGVNLVGTEADPLVGGDAVVVHSTVLVTVSI